MVSTRIFPLVVLTIIRHLLLAPPLGRLRVRSLTPGSSDALFFDQNDAPELPPELLKKRSFTPKLQKTVEKTDQATDRTVNRLDR